MSFLKLALIHSAAEHKQTARNRDRLLDLFRQAGEAGAQLVVAPEMAVSGYSFDNRQDIAPYTETASGPTVTALAELARHHGLYACIGLAERDVRSSIFYNSAFVLDPQGVLVCRYRKINAEYRWACPGNPRADNTFVTPWGRVGVLICSDSYHSLLPRITALRGADLLLIPANWPPTGLDPREIWRTRALENGIVVAACNRTGMDLVMDCRQGPSAVFDPHGATLLNCSSPDSRLLLVDLHLNADRQLATARRQRLAQRRMADIGDCYLNLAGISDLTSFLRLPPPGRLAIECLVAQSPGQTIEELTTAPRFGEEQQTLLVLPAGEYGDVALDRLQTLCAKTGLNIVVYREGENAGLYWLDGKGEPRCWPWQRHQPRETALPRIDCGSARVLLAPLAALRHPEPVLAGVKQGCDLVVTSEAHLSADDRLIAGVRTIEGLAVAVCAGNGSGVWMTPEGHQRWEEVLAGPGESCRYLLDTHRTRKKRFQDRVDYDRLLANDD